MAKTNVKRATTSATKKAVNKAPKKTAPATATKQAAATATKHAAAKPAPTAARLAPPRESKGAPAKIDAKRDAALLLLPSSYADTPDLPVEVAVAELAALYKLAKKEARTLTRFGISSKQIEELGTLGKELGDRQRTWITQRDHTTSSDAKTLRQEADLLKRKMLAAGEWALRYDDDALGELARIREGAGLPDTIEDLYHLTNFWTKHAREIAHTRLEGSEVKRAVALAELLHEVASDDVSNTDAARALELRNRCFWVATAAANEIRLGGRYAFHDQPKIAARFASRYRAAKNRRLRQKTNGAGVGAAAPGAAKPAPN